MARVEEKMSSIFARLRTHGGIGNIVYQWEGKLAVLSLQPVAVRPLDEPVQPVGLTAELGTLVAAMAETGSHHMIIRPKAPIDGQALIETRSMAPVG
jgi:hypothetical protein